MNFIVINLFLSGTIIQPFNKGNLYGKTALELNRDQLINEIINQFWNRMF